MALITSPLKTGRHDPKVIGLRLFQRRPGNL
jgi:hypothetical protein